MHFNVRTLLDSVKERENGGRINLLVCSAGVTSPCRERRTRPRLMTALSASRSRPEEFEEK